ncbi:MAG TPA: hypothetical protein QGF58_05275 [Myxococcota bacterium]|nr:hypothetical protein [Myxococcota bacterium]
MILLLGCAPLLQDEVAVPWEVATRTLEGALGYGRVLLVDGERIVVGSDDAVCDGSDCYAARDPLAVCVDTTLQWIEPDGLYGPTGRVRDFQSTAHAADFGPGCEWAVAHGGGVASSYGDFAFEDPRAVSIGDTLLVLECSESCVVLDAESGDAVGEAGEGGQVVHWAEGIWWSDPQVGLDGGAGLVRGSSEHAGRPGDHLGRAIGGGYAAGTYNIDEAPGRLRLVPLGEGPVLALDRSSIGRPIVLAGDRETLAIGLPHGPDLGRVHLISRDAL